MLSLEYYMPCQHPPTFCLVLGYIMKQIFHAIFCLILKLFTFGKAIFNSAPFVQYFYIG